MNTSGRAWIITRAANGNVLTYDVFKSNGFHVDECHYTMDAAVMYVYVHLTVKASRCQFASFLDKMESERHIMPFEIFGYESFTHDTKDGSLVEHVGFKVLLNHYQTKNPSFKSCTDGVEGVVRGLLWENDYAERIRECLQSRNASMAKFFADVQMKAALCGQHEECIELMRDEIRAYEERIQRCKTRLRELNQCKFAFLVLKDRIAALDPASQELLLEPDHLGRPIFPSWADGCQ